MTLTVSQNLPPVPSAMKIAQGEMVTQPWQQWFVNLTAKVNQINAVLVAISGAGTPLAAFNALSPLTTNGDMLTYSSGNNVRLPIGTNGQILSVVSGFPTWVNASAGSSPLTTKGDIYTYGTTNARLPVGSDGQVLTARSSATLGVDWETPSSGSTNYDSVVLADSPIGYWKLAETSGTTAADSSGNSLNGTYNGGFTFIGSYGPGNLPGGVILDGSSGYISIPSNALLNVGNNWSAEGWCFLYATANFPCIITSAASATSFVLGFNFDASLSASTIMGGYYTGSAWVRSAGPICNNTNLYHAVITYDNSFLRLYLNGSLISRISATSHVASAAGIYLGTRTIGSGAFINGIISCCAIYGTTLSAARIQAHYLAGR